MPEADPSSSKFIPNISIDSVRFRSITFSLSGTVILNNINFDCEGGKINSIVGPSGSGKTTLLQMINGLRKPDSGEVFIGNEKLLYDTGSLSQRRKKTGYAIQEHGLFPHLTAWQNVTLPGKLEKWEKQRQKERAEFLFATVHLPEEKWSSYPHELSGGERQRVGMARALFLDPPVLLLDEAFGALDPVTRAALHFEFLDIQARIPRTIVMVTHDIEEALLLSDTITILKKGELIQSGEKQEVLKNPANQFVSSYLKSDRRKLL